MPASLHLDQMPQCPIIFSFLSIQENINSLYSHAVISMDRTFCRPNFNKNQNDQEKGGRGLHTGHD